MCKKLLSFLLAVTLMAGVFATGVNEVSAKTKHMLDGKKVIFIGNSLTHAGKATIDRGYGTDDATMNLRFKDEGYFYQLCKANGINISVTGWTWGGHSLNDIMGGKCGTKKSCKNRDHLADLKRLASDMKYDYVVIQPSSAETVESITAGIKLIKEVFEKENPDVKFIFNVHHLLYTWSASNCNQEPAPYIDQIARDNNVYLANWGIIIGDILSGKAVVENSTQEYTRNTFIVSKSATDGHHENMLAGYITAQVVYSTITGEKALGQDYSFCTSDTLASGKFKLSKYLRDNYVYDNISPEGSTTTLTGDDLTNFPEIFASPTEMAGIQKLIDKYLNRENKIVSYSSDKNEATVVLKEPGTYKVFFADNNGELLVNATLKTFTVNNGEVGKEIAVSMPEGNTFAMGTGDRIMLWNEKFAPVCEAFVLQ